MDTRKPKEINIHKRVIVMDGRHPRYLQRGFVSWKDANMARVKFSDRSDQLIPMESLRLAA